MVMPIVARHEVAFVLFALLWFPAAFYCEISKAVWKSIQG